METITTASPAPPEAAANGERSSPPARLEPRSVDEVVAMVLAARLARQPLYPVSTGLNWGYGSAQPVLPGCRVMDLSAMRTIRNADQISLANPVAVIEPGVTQGQLADFLARHCPELTFNATGSARATSIIGNTLERGVGYYGPRHLDLFGFEVVTGTGERLHTGFRRLGEDSPLAHTHPAGLGPMLDGLFLQGNFGIVTSACFRLVPRRPREVAVSMALRDPRELGAFVDLLARFKREGLVDSVSHIGNRARTRATLLHGAAHYLVERCALAPGDALREADAALATMGRAEWTSLGAVRGNAAQVRAAVGEMRRRARGLASVAVVTQRRLDGAFALTDRLRRIGAARRAAALLAAVRPLHGLCLGRPTDAPVQNLMRAFDDRALPAQALDDSACGLLYVCPALPMDGGFVAETVARLQATARHHGHDLAITLNIETATSLVAVTNLAYDRRDPAQQARAQRCADAMHGLIRDAGLEVYRARADMMPGIVERNPAHWQTVARLQRALDPDGVIAPGRYCLLP